MNSNPERYVACREIDLTIVMYPEFEAILQAADALTDKAAVSAQPEGIMIQAESGMGKSEILNLIATRCRRRCVGLTNEDPVVFVVCESLIDPHKLASACLRALGFPGIVGRASLEVTTQMIDDALRRVKPQMLVIDEGQHACEGNRDLTARATADWLKRRMDIHNLIVIFAGTKVVGRLRDISTQFTSRVATEYAIRTFTYGPVWIEFLTAMATVVKSANLGVIADKRNAKRICEGSRGNLRSLKKWLRWTTVSALSEQRVEVSVVDLERGFNIAFGTNSPIPNPFTGLK